MLLMNDAHTREEEAVRANYEAAMARLRKAKLEVEAAQKAVQAASRRCEDAGVTVPVVALDRTDAR